MRRILTIFQYTVLRNLRDTGNTVFQMLVFPIVLIFILGMALAPAFDHTQFNPTNVGYINEDQGPMGEHFHQFLANPEIGNLLNITSVQSKEEGLDLVKSGGITALIHLKADFSQQVSAGNPAAIQLTGHPSRPLGVAMVENVIESFLHGANAVQAMAAMGNPQPEFTFAEGIIQDLPISASGLMPSSMDYYAVTMLIMIIMYGALYATYGMGQSYLAEIGQRIKGSPIRPLEQYFGLILANVVTVYTQVLVILAFTHFVFGVSWGDNLSLILFIAFVMVVLAIGLGTMMVMLTKNETRASGLVNVIIVAGTFIAGGYFKVSLPGVLGYIQYLSPNYLAQTAMFNTIYGGPANQTILMIAGLLAIITATFAVAMLAERRTAK